MSNGLDGFKKIGFGKNFSLDDSSTSIKNPITSTGGTKRKSKTTMYGDFQARYKEYSTIEKGLKSHIDKTKTDKQVPAFAIRLFSDEILAPYKKYPNLYKELSSLSIIFQYIRYRPKKSYQEYIAKEVYKARKEYERKKYLAKRKGISTTGWKIPTAKSLGYKYSFDKFKETYPKILYRKADTTLDVIKSDWTGYLINIVRYPLRDQEVVGSDYFFKVPATIKKNTKDELDETLFKRLNRVFSKIEAIAFKFSLGASPESLEYYMRDIVMCAKSLTVEGLDEAYQKRQEKDTLKDLKKQFKIGSLENEEVDFLGVNSQSDEDDLDESYKETSMSWNDVDKKKTVSLETINDISTDFDTLDDVEFETPKKKEEKQKKDESAGMFNVDWSGFE